MKTTPKIHATGGKRKIRKGSGFKTQYIYIKFSYFIYIYI